MTVIEQTATPLWRQFFAKAFSRPYRSTRWMLVFVIAQYYLFAPVEPWVPDKGELHEISGKAEFKKYLAGRSSGVHFKIDGVLLHCAFTGMSGGLEGCDYFEDQIDKSKPAVATWFLMPTKHYIQAKMLNSVSQDGGIRVTPEMTYEGRMLSYKSNRKIKGFFDLLFIAIWVVFFCTDRRNDKQSSAKLKG